MLNPKDTRFFCELDKDERDYLENVIEWHSWEKALSDEEYNAAFDSRVCDLVDLMTEYDEENYLIGIIDGTPWNCSVKVGDFARYKYQFYEDYDEVKQAYARLLGLHEAIYWVINE